MDKHQAELDHIRREIDELDKVLLSTLKQRFKFVEKIARVKKKLKMGTHQKGRWEEMLQIRLGIAARLRLEEEFTLSFFKLIHKESKRIQLESKTKDKK